MQQLSSFMPRCVGLRVYSWWEWNGMPVWGQHPCSGARGQSHSTAPRFHPCEIQQGMDGKSQKQNGIWNCALEIRYMGNEKDGLATVFSYRNEQDSDALAIIKS